MGSSPGRELIDWYATPELQIILCFCGLTHEFLKKKHGKAIDGVFWRTLKHHIPHIEEYIPEKFRDKFLINRLKNRGDKLNRYEHEHPTHPSKQNSTGRFWEWAKTRFNGIEGEFTLSREEIAKVIFKCTGGELLLVEVLPTTYEKEPEEFINLNNLLDQVNRLESKVEELTSELDLIKGHLVRR